MFKIILHPPSELFPFRLDSVVNVDSLSLVGSGSSVLGASGTSRRLLLNLRPLRINRPSGRSTHTSRSPLQQLSSRHCDFVSAGSPSRARSQSGSSQHSSRHRSGSDTSGIQPSRLAPAAIEAGSRPRREPGAGSELHSQARSESGQSRTQSGKSQNRNVCILTLNARIVSRNQLQHKRATSCFGGLLLSQFFHLSQVRTASPRPLRHHRDSKFKPNDSFLIILFCFKQ